ncbi:Serine/threonine-protein kinase STY17 [Porphyridium purpureum]|uniref:Serine/threonine-protein kinase STY17 n=1 Tax=Porphyridium purpureum TaxID=35688 RepID=A0A5J4Z3W7_PORPP|nr:Serine/threonine-protein kinase STY17 [Porphyridium purpureum]|eukprot:POR7224..scf295_1
MAGAYSPPGGGKGWDAELLDSARLKLTRDAEHLLAAGSYGEVYRGTLDGSVVACKVTTEQVKALPSTPEEKRQEQLEDHNVERRQQEQNEKDRYKGTHPLIQLQREMRRYRRMRNPYIVQFLGGCADPLDPAKIVLVTELMRGGSLSSGFSCLRQARIAALEKMKTPLRTGIESHQNVFLVHLNLESVIRIALHVVLGLQYLHAERISHGDLKPGNILISAPFTPMPVHMSLEADKLHWVPRLITHTSGVMRDEELRNFVQLYESPELAVTKLTDFGLSRREALLDSHNPNPNYSVQVGTLAYLAPEMFGGARLDFDGMAKADIFAFSLVMFELLTLQRPWEGFDARQLYSALVLADKRPEWPKWCLFLRSKSAIMEALMSLTELSWSTDPRRRPSASHLSTKLNALSEQIESIGSRLGTAKSGLPEMYPGDLAAVPSSAASASYSPGATSAGGGDSQWGHEEQGEKPAVSLPTSAEGSSAAKNAAKLPHGDSDRDTTVSAQDALRSAVISTSLVEPEAKATMAASHVRRSAEQVLPEQHLGDIDASDTLVGVVQQGGAEDRARVAATGSHGPQRDSQRRLVTPAPTQRTSMHPAPYRIQDILSSASAFEAMSMDDIDAEMNPEVAKEAVKRADGGAGIPEKPNREHLAQTAAVPAGSEQQPARTPSGLAGQTFSLYPNVVSFHASGGGPTAQTAPGSGYTWSDGRQNEALSQPPARQSPERARMEEKVAGISWLSIVADLEKGVTASPADKGVNQSLELAVGFLDLRCPGVTERVNRIQRLWPSLSDMVARAANEHVRLCLCFQLIAMAFQTNIEFNRQVQTSGEMVVRHTSVSDQAHLAEFVAPALTAMTRFGSVSRSLSLAVSGVLVAAAWYSTPARRVFVSTHTVKKLMDQVDPSSFASFDEPNMSNHHQDSLCMALGALAASGAVLQALSEGNLFFTVMRSDQSSTWVLGSVFNTSLNLLMVLSGSAAPDNVAKTSRSDLRLLTGVALRDLSIIASCLFKEGRNRPFRRADERLRLSEAAAIVLGEMRRRPQSAQVQVDGCLYLRSVCATSSVKDEADCRLMRVLVAKEGAVEALTSVVVNFGLHPWQSASFIYVVTPTLAALGAFKSLIGDTEALARASGCGLLRSLSQLLGRCLANAVVIESACGVLLVLLRECGGGLRGAGTGRYKVDATELQQVLDMLSQTFSVILKNRSLAELPSVRAVSHELIRLQGRRGGSSGGAGGSGNNVSGVTLSMGGSVDPSLGGPAQRLLVAPAAQAAQAMRNSFKHAFSVGQKGANEQMD